MELPASVLNSQLRQDIIRSQANLLANSIAPPANLTIEEFLRERPNQRQPRIPFDPGWAIEPAGPEAEKMAADVTPQALSGGSVGDTPGYLRSGVGGRMGRLPDTSGLESAGVGSARLGSAVPSQSAPGPAATSGADAPRAESMPVEQAAQSRSDGRWLNSQASGSNSQIVVIIRGKKPTVSARPEATQPTEPARGPRD